MAGFPFPPPLLGVAPGTACAAAAGWLREVAAIVSTGPMNLSALFAAAPATLVLREHALPVITATGMYALGAATFAGAPTLAHLFATPPAIHLAHLTEAARLLER